MAIAADPAILVVGGVSWDTITLPDGSTYSAPGGAALYTAQGVWAAGGRVTLYALRPDPLPEAFAPIAAHADWTATTIPTADLPTLHIRHNGGGQAQLLRATWGGATVLDPQHLPADLSSFAWVHICGLATVAQQQAFVQVARQRGAPRISLGTYRSLAQRETAALRELATQVDFFFCNEAEAAILFDDWVARPIRQPQPAPLGLAVTCAARGALLWQGEQHWLIPAPIVPEINPTGAGDLFCGALLAGWARGLSLPLAATQACQVAAQRVGAKHLNSEFENL